MMSTRSNSYFHHFLVLVVKFVKPDRVDLLHKEFKYDLSAAIFKSLYLSISPVEVKIKKNGF